MTTSLIMHEGQMLSAEALRIAEIIYDYDPRLELAWIPPNVRTLNEEHPYAVIYNDPSGRRDVVMRLRETELDHRVLARLWENDTASGNNILSSIEAEESARQAIELKKQQDDLEEKRELAAWMVKAPVGARHNGIRLT